MRSSEDLSPAQQLQADIDHSDKDNSVEPGQSGSASSELDGDEDDAALEAAMFASDNEQDLSEEEEQGVPQHLGDRPQQRCMQIVRVPVTLQVEMSRQSRHSWLWCPLPPIRHLSSWRWQSTLRKMPDCCFMQGMSVLLCRSCWLMQ